MPIGDNSNLSANEARLLKGYVSELERINAEKAELAVQTADVMKSAKDAGLSSKVIREAIKFRANREEIEATEIMRDAYLLALGDLSDTPLGRAAVTAEFKAPNTSDSPF